MNLRDTILFAVLINSGVLALLFMFAVDDEIKIPPSPPAERVVRLETKPKSDFSFASLEEDKTVIAEEDPEDLSQHDPVLPEEEGIVFSEPTPVPQNGQVVDVTVKKGDVLERIARANGTTVDAIKKLNNLKTERLMVGQVLKVPVNTTKKAQEKSTVAVNNTLTEKPSLPGISNAEPVYYTIKSGDNPWKIAKQFHVKFEELLRLNNLDEEKARNMKIGDRIRVR